MKKLVLFAAGWMITACAPPASPEVAGTITKTISLKGLFTIKQAEKILGQKAHLADSSSANSNDLYLYKCGFQADEPDMKKQKTGAVYFLVEHYYNSIVAQNKYSSIKQANADHDIKELEHLGDEAYFHTDRKNFYFVMVRKGSVVFNMKVNKITSKTSLDEFNNTAKEIVAAL